MPKLYTKDTWTDEVLADDALHKITDPAGDPIPGSVTDLTTAIAALNSLLEILETGSKISLITDVSVAGTSLNAARMNNIEDGIDTLDDSLDLENAAEKETPTAGDLLLLADSEDGYSHKSVDFSNLGGGSAPATTAENDFQVGDGSGSWIKKTLAETKTILAVLESLVGDTTPQLGGDLDMNDHGISVNVEPTDDLDYQGIVTTMTVDTNAEGVGAPLFLAADGHLDTADADTVATAPCVALALETGTGSKKVLLMGTLRVDAWNWTIGPGATSLIYLSETVGTLTQTKPTTEDAVVQPVGFALTDDMIMFNPSMIFITHAA